MPVYDETMTNRRIYQNNFNRHTITKDSTEWAVDKAYRWKNAIEIVTFAKKNTFIKLSPWSAISPIGGR